MWSGFLGTLKWILRTGTRTRFFFAIEIWQLKRQSFLKHMAKIEIVHLILLNFPDDETGFQIFIGVRFSDWGNSLHPHFNTQKCNVERWTQKLRKHTVMAFYATDFLATWFLCSQENENAWTASLRIKATERRRKKNVAFEQKLV